MQAPSTPSLHTWTALFCSHSSLQGEGKTGTVHLKSYFLQCQKEAGEVEREKTKENEQNNAFPETEHRLPVLSQAEQFGLRLEGSFQVGSAVCALGSR